jgi:TIR domain
VSIAVKVCGLLAALTGVFSNIGGSKMSTLSDDFLQKLTSYLGSLPIVHQGEERDLSWRDAEQILSHWKAQVWEAPTSDADTLDRFLLAELGERPGAFPLRSAKYPGRSTIRRLWGHTDRVGKTPSAAAALTLRRQLVFEEIEFEEIELPLDAPQIFLSHSHLDVHFVGRVRLELGRLGLKAWMSEEGLRDGDLIIEGIKHAVRQSTAVIGLLTRRSLTAAWFDTEVYGGCINRPSQDVILACDSSDEDLLVLLSHWFPGSHWLPESLPIPPECKDRISRMKQSLRYELSSARFDKYEYSARHFMEWLSNWKATKTMYPRMPPDWHGNTEFRDFSKVINERLSIWSAGPDACNGRPTQL